MRLTEQMIIESPRGQREDDSSMVLRVPFLKADEAGGNGRTYPLKILTTAVSKLKEALARMKYVYGSSKHIEGNMEVDQVSHRIEDVEMDGETAFAKLRILATSKGKNLMAILTGGGAVGISSRGNGEVKEGKVQDGFKLLGIDFCLNPAFGFHASKDMICESQSLDLDNLHSDEVLRARYFSAVRIAGLKGVTFEAYKALTLKEAEKEVEVEVSIEDRELVHRAYDQAVKNGYKGDFEQWIDKTAKKIGD